MALKIVSNYKDHLSPWLRKAFWLCVILGGISQCIIWFTDENLQLFGFQIFAVYYIALEVKIISYMFLMLFLAYLLKPEVSNKFIDPYDD